MNIVTVTGRLTADPIIHRMGKVTVANYTLAVRRPYARVGRPYADFIRCSTFGPRAEFAESRLHRGMKIEVSGSLRTGSYINKEGQKVYTTELVVSNQEFAERLSVELGYMGEDVDD